MSEANHPVEIRLAEIRTFLDSLSEFERDEARDHLVRMEEYAAPLSDVGEKLLNAVLDLKFGEQMALVEKVQFIHSRPPGIMSANDPRFPDMLAERLRKHESGEDKGTPWEEVKARLEAKFAKFSPPSITADSAD